MRKSRADIQLLKDDKEQARSEIKRQLRSVRKKLRKICKAWKNAENGYSLIMDNVSKEIKEYGTVKTVTYRKLGH